MILVESSGGGPDFMFPPPLVPPTELVLPPTHIVPPSSAELTEDGTVFFVGSDTPDATLVVDPVEARRMFIAAALEPTAPDAAGILLEQQLGLLSTDGTLQVLAGVDTNGNNAELIAWHPPPPSMEQLASADETRRSMTPAERFAADGMPIASFMYALHRGPLWRRLIGALSGFALGAFACGGSNLAPRPNLPTPSLPPPGATIEPTPAGASTPPTPPETSLTQATSLEDGGALSDRFVYGRPPGFGGGEWEQTSIANDYHVEPALVDQGLQPIFEQQDDPSGATRQIASHESFNGGVTLCVANAPDVLFAPDRPSRDEVRLSEHGGVVFFGQPGPDGVVGTPDDVVQTKVVAAVPLPENTPPELTCVAAVVTDPDDPAGLGAIRMLLVDTDRQTIVGDMRAGFAGTSDVVMDPETGVQVDGQPIIFELRPGETLATVTAISPPPTEAPPATVTATPTELPATATKTPTEKPTAVQPPPTEALPTVAPPPTATLEQIIPQQPGTWAKEGTQWECRLCTWDTRYLSSPNLKQLILTAWDGNTRTYARDHLSVEEFNAEVERLKRDGYKPFSVNIGQDQSYGDPTTGQIAPQNLWYTMVK